MKTIAFVAAVCSFAMTTIAAPVQSVAAASTRASSLESVPVSNVPESKASVLPKTDARGLDAQNPSAMDQSFSRETDPDPGPYNFGNNFGAHGKISSRAIASEDLDKEMTIASAAAIPEKKRNSKRRFGFKFIPFLIHPHRVHGRPSREDPPSVKGKARLRRFSQQTDASMPVSTPTPRATGEA
ncbi:MAG: hypothetical protein M1822_010065 [Bathelium mastoideum]|nr:MAG: hypothetical protein M1822_010065 [Bathelium mastoideum]